jgi:hypothetical protein
LNRCEPITATTQAAATIDVTSPDVELIIRFAAKLFADALAASEWGE